MAYAEPIKNPVDKTDPSYIRQSTPNRKLPWCPACERHTDYHLKVIGCDPKTGGEKTASFYTCNECGGDTWKLTNPLPINLISLLLFGFMLFGMCPWALMEMDRDPETVMVLPITAYIGYRLYRNSRKNSTHWRKFRAWARRKRI